MVRFSVLHAKATSTALRNTSASSRTNGAWLDMLHDPSYHSVTGFHAAAKRALEAIGFSEVKVTKITKKFDRPSDRSRVTFGLVDGGAEGALERLPWHRLHVKGLHFKLRESKFFCDIKWVSNQIAKMAKFNKQ